MTILLNRRAAAVALALALPAAGLTGCSSAQDAATAVAGQASSAANAAAGSAAAVASAKASEAVTALVTQQICQLAGDGLTATDLSSVKAALAQLKSAQLPTDLLRQAQQIADAGTASAAQVDELKATCAKT